MVFNMLRSESMHFRSLSAGARSLLISFISFGFAAPLMSVFTNAFIWRQQQDLITIALFNGAWMVGLSLMFIFNGYLLRYLKISTLYAAGLVLQSALTLILFTLEGTTLSDLLVIGLVSGGTAGIYWPNRNVLTLQVTASQDRDYFCGIESSLGAFLSVVSPAVCGWFIQLGFQAAGGGILDRYRSLAFLILVMQLIGAWYILRAPFKDFSPAGVLVRSASPYWNRVRAFITLKGIAEGSAIFIPTLLILRLIGAEGTAGTVQSIATLIASSVMYGVGRVMKPRTRDLFLNCGIALMVTGGLTLSLTYSPLGTFAYIILETLAVQIMWGAANPIIFDAIDADRKCDKDPYRYIVDRELFLNLGRLTGVGIVIILSLFCNIDLTLRIAPLILAIATSCLVFVRRNTATRPCSNQTNAA